MASVIFHFATIEVDLNTGPDIQDITDGLNRIIGRSGIENGQASACIIGSTGSLTSCVAFSYNRPLVRWVLDPPFFSEISINGGYYNGK
jgi:hypothetical protein